MSKLRMSSPYYFPYIMCMNFQVFFFCDYTCIKIFDFAYIPRGFKSRCTFPGARGMMSSTRYFAYTYSLCVTYCCFMKLCKNFKIPYLSYFLSDFDELSLFCLFKFSLLTYLLIQINLQIGQTFINKFGFCLQKWKL